MARTLFEDSNPFELLFFARSLGDDRPEILQTHSSPAGWWLAVRQTHMVGLSTLHVALAYAVAAPLATQQMTERMAARSVSMMSRPKRGGSQVNRALQRLRRGAAAEAVDTTDEHDEKHVNADDVKLLVYEDSKGQEWMALGGNKSAAIKWLCYELGDSAITEVDVHEVHLKIGDRKAHQRIQRLWRSSRLLVRDYRLSDLALHGRMHAERIALTEPRRSRRLIERAFRSELEANVQRARRLYNPSITERRRILYFVRAASGLDLAPLVSPKQQRRKASASSSSRSSSTTTPTLATASASISTEATPLQSLDEWRELLSWFRDHFPYNRAACASCGLQGDFLGNVYPGTAERTSEGSTSARL